MDGVFPVEKRRTKVYCAQELQQLPARTAEPPRLRADLRLFHLASRIESSLRSHLLPIPSADTAHVDIHRYEEEIAGRTYHIEVHAVSREQWRAKLARRPGMPTALMPFYGKTPELAARELTNWLSLVAARPR